MIYRALLIKYAEIGIKGQNRYVFEDALCDKVRERLKAVADGFTCVREQGRIFVSCPEEYDFDEAIAAIKTIFGVWAICPAAVIRSRLRRAALTRNIRSSLPRSARTWADTCSSVSLSLRLTFTTPM